MTNHRIPALICTALAISCSGCASMTNGPRQNVSVSSTPSGADVILDGATVGTTPWSGPVPRASSKSIVVRKTGYRDAMITADGKLSNTFWLGDGVFFLLGAGLFSSTTDVATGAAYEYAPGSYQVTLDHGDGH